MTTTFLLPLCIGACDAVGGNVMTDAFGVVALVALTPLIAVQIMGIVYQFKMRIAAQPAMQGAVSLDAMDEIFEFEEDYEYDEP